MGCLVYFLNSYNLIPLNFSLIPNNISVNGKWGAWSTWGTCSKTCGGGTQSRTRLCDNPAPANGGAACTGNATASQTCNSLTCSSG